MVEYKISKLKKHFFYDLILINILLVTSINKKRNACIWRKKEAPEIANEAS